jgi:hypothetical protein
LTKWVHPYGQTVILRSIIRQFKQIESSSLNWYVYNGGIVDIIADRSDVTDSSKYSTSKNPSTGLYYRLQILNVGVSDVKKYRCQGFNNGMILNFYLQLILLGRCNHSHCFD